MRRQRCFLPTEVYFVTIRTTEERFALIPHACPGAWQLVEGAHPDEEERIAMANRGRVCVEQTEALTNEIARAERNVNHPRPHVSHATFTDSIPNILGGWLARGVKKYGINLYGFVWMSNHVHLLFQAPHDNVAEFMGYLNGHVAANVNRFLCRRHSLWSRRYAAAPVLDDEAELEKLAYILANPQNAGIAERIEDWPGLSSASFLFNNRKQRFLCFDRTAWHKNGRPQDIAPFLSTIELEQQLLPQLAGLDQNAIRQKLRELIRQKSKSIPTSIAQGANAPSSFMRRRMQPRTSIPTDRPARPRESRQPLCHTTKPSLHKLYRDWYRWFRIAYKDSSYQYMQGNTNVVFPAGSFAPSKHPRARHPQDPENLGLRYPSRKNLHTAEACARDAVYQTLNASQLHWN